MTRRAKPAADVVIDAGLVQRLLHEQHPDLAHQALVKIAEGWDNAVFRLGNDLAVRLPRRAASARLIEHEQRWLPHLSSALPVPVPAPVRVGMPSTTFEWAWSVFRWLPGQSLLHGGATAPRKTASMLRRFLQALHRPAPEDAPTNPWRGVRLDARTAALHEHLHQLGAAVDRTPILQLWDRALAAPTWPGPPLWLHGDLHPGNLLVSDAGLTGVIDFGDLTSGDPATDLAVRWMLPRSMRESFDGWTEDPEADALRMRARAWALALSLAYLAHSRDDASMATLGHETINAALSEP